MDIKQHNINDLVFAEYNPRQLTKEQYKNLKDSIKRFGLVDPVIINKNKDRENIVIGGHQRLKIAKDLNIEKIPCVELDLTIDQEKELNVRLNKNTGEWDWDALGNYFDVESLIDWGFTNEELQFETPDVVGLTDEDEIPEKVTPRTKLGDIWILGNHKLLCGDCTDFENIDQLLLDQKAHMIFTDPPWNVAYGKDKHPRYKNNQILNDNMSTDDFQIFLNKSFNSLAKLSMKGTIVYLVMSAQEWGNAMLEMKKNNFHWSSTIIWNKDRHVISRKDYHTKYEPIWYGWYDSHRIKKLSDRKQSDVWDFKKPLKSKLHPTTKPVELVERAIKNSSDPNNLVVDLFLGSGSTLIACEKTNRKCFGMELDPKYCDVIVQRWEDYTGKKAILMESASA